MIPFKMISDEIRAYITGRGEYDLYIPVGFNGKIIIDTSWFSQEYGYGELMVLYFPFGFNESRIIRPEQPKGNSTKEAVIDIKKYPEIKTSGIMIMFWKNQKGMVGIPETVQVTFKQRVKRWG